MSKRTGAREAQPQDDAARRAKDAERKRRAYWADSVKARAKSRAKRQRRLEHYRAMERARYWREVEKSRARARAFARSPRGRELNRRAVARYKARHPERIRAQTEARAAARRGQIRIPTVCEVLGCSATDLHLHHPRYDRPLDVIAACRRHHEELHHRGPLELKPGGRRRWARAPRQRPERAKAQQRAAVATT
jgi:hypothetical protein